MKVLLLSDINSIHTRRWATALREKGLEVGIFSFTRLVGKGDAYKGIEVFSHGIPDKFLEGLNVRGKLRYFTSLSRLKKVIRSFKPDILHAHYAYNYGTLGALSGFHPFILSVWGSDIYKFPKGSRMKEWLIRRNLEKADRILSTSHAMAEETRKYTDKNIDVTPFGIDLSKFRPYPVEREFPEGSIVIGTTKALEKIYGIEFLVEAFGRVRKAHRGLSLKLLICSNGSQETMLREKVHNLGLEEDVAFIGNVPHEQIPDWLNKMDIYAAPSVSESFGVAIIEASACEIPVVVSDVGGLKEVVHDGVTGFRVPQGDMDKAIEAFTRLIIDPGLRKEMGKNGRERVRKLYDWNDNVNTMITIYQQALAERKQHTS
jgi:L-malate glycosyltransferase